MKFLIKVILFSICSSPLLSVADNCVYGCPSGSNGQLIQRNNYTLRNNATTKFADWAAYHVTQSTIDGPSRSRYWRADPDIASANTLEPADYTSANAQIGTDRGHMVPLGSFTNTSSWAELNYLSNITPQDSDLNQGPWVDLENAVRGIVRSGQDVYVVTGTLYEWFFASLPGADENHRIPSGYFKVVITDDNGWVEASAFIMEQSAARSDDHCNYELSVDEVEARSGLNIMPSLPSYKENAVEYYSFGLSSQLGC